MPTSSATDRVRVLQGDALRETDATALAGEAREASSPQAFDGPTRRPNTQTALSVSGLRKSYNGQAEVLKGIDFAIDDGEAVGIIGANGSGKSTALRCALRLIEPSAGSIHLGGRNISGLHGKDLRRARSRIGFVFQKHNLSPNLSVLTNVIHGGLARGHGIRAWCQAVAGADERRRAMDCLDQVGLADLAERRAGRLSGGQSQRVAIARALMQEPVMIVADEPVASLDPKAGEDVMDLFRRLRSDRGITLVFVSHNLEHALSYSDRLIGLREGKLVLDRPTDGLEPQHLSWLYETETPA